MSRARKLAISTFVALLAATPFIPRGDDSGGAIRPSGDKKNAAPSTHGQGTLTPAMRREIDRVVAAGRQLGRVSARQAPSELADSLVRCADFEGQRYCLHSGWTTSSEADVRARAAAATRTLAARRAGGVETTGDLDLAATLQRAAALSPAERAAAERRELTAAARSVAKVWLLRHEVQGAPLPAGFSQAHPEASLSARSGTTSTTTTTRTKHAAAYPEVGKVLRSWRTAEQRTTYWCGPTTMQMIAWGWQGERRSQGHWADRLGTTTSGSAITDMVRVVNSATGYDRESRAGTYIVLDISDWSFREWALLNMRHIVDYRAPLVLHPVLLKRYFPYLDDDASGHFQVGRGYNKDGDQPLKIGYFEPWNQQRFDPSEPFISRVQWRSAYRSYRANRAHFQHNIGV
jgi:Peptidase_C39 like family